MSENLNKKQKLIIILILIIMLFFILYYIYTVLGKIPNDDLIDNEAGIDNELNAFDTDDNIDLEENTLVSSTKETILVHVSGQVKKNTVVELDSGSRIKDAIESAGGLTKEADLTHINLAYILEDGEKIYIPKKGEKIEEEEVGVVGLGADTSVLPSSSSTKSSKININKATQTELESIPGVGPSTAQKIIDYREENGKFTSVEDIKNVSGIGNAKYEKMKDYIKLK